VGAKERHLVLGGAGFVGRHVALALAARGVEVVLASRRPPPEPERFDPQCVRLETVDLTACDWPALIADVDVIHHYAWASIPQTAALNPIWDVDTHIRTAINLLETAGRLGGKRVLFVSSGGTVYGRHKDQRSTEDSPTRPLSIYGATKLAVENYMRPYHDSGAVDCRIARLSNPYGVGQNLDRNQGLVSTFVARALRGEPLTVWGDGSVVRDYIHISDATDALVALSTQALPDLTDLPVFNVASGVGVSINEVISVIEGVLDRTLDVSRLPGRGIDIPVSVLCVDKARRHLGWAPRYSLGQGVSAMIEQLKSGETSYSRP
jgi:UDP-glucose 4-epimerase